MNLEELAVKVLDAVEATEVPFMAVGAIAAGAYGVPRSTRDIDLLVALHTGGGILSVMQALEPLLEFDPQAQFDTLTWGRRQIGTTFSQPHMKVELFEMFDDPFVLSEFDRRQRVFVPLLNRHTWLPTAEDVVVQKLRWGRNKDLDDARDVLAVQGPEALDMSYIRNWCGLHNTTSRLEDALSGIPPL